MKRVLYIAGLITLLILGTGALLSAIAFPLILGLFFEVGTEPAWILNLTDPVEGFGANYRFYLIGSVGLLAIVVAAKNIIDLSSGKIVTLKIESTGVAVMEMKNDEVLKWGTAPLEPGLVKEGLILQPQAVGKAIDALFQSMKINKNKVIVSVTGLHSVHRIIALPPTEPAMLEEAIMRGAKRGMPVPLEDIHLSWKRIGSKDGQKQYFVLGTPRHLINAYIQALAEAKIKPHIMDLKPLALARVVNQGNAIVIDLEKDSYGIILIANGLPTVMHTIIPREEEDLIEDNILRLNEEILKTVEFYNRDSEGNLSSSMQAFFTGELADDDAIMELVKKDIEYPVEVLKPTAQYVEDFPVAQYSANFGLSMKLNKLKAKVAKNGKTFRDFNFNILPDEYKRRNMRFQYSLLVMLAAAVIGGLFPVYQVKSQSDAEVAQLQLRYDTIRRDLNQIRLTLNSQKKIEEKIEVAVAESEVLEKEYLSKLSVESETSQMVSRILEIVPSGSHLKSIALSQGQIRLKGQVDNSSDVITFARILEDEPAFSQVSVLEVTDKTFSIIIDIIE